jgi:hypothetical protein
MAYVTRHHAAVGRIDPGPNVTFVRIKDSGVALVRPTLTKVLSPRRGNHEKADAPGGADSFRHGVPGL